MKNNKTSVSVEIYGTRYKLVADAASSPGYVTMVAAHVNEQMVHISQNFNRLDMAKIAVLAAINIADEMFQLKDEVAKLKTAKQLQSEAEYEQLQHEHARLWEQFRELQDDHKALRAAGNIAPVDAANRSIYEEYEKLKNEYMKLQNEYNEWIQLVDQTGAK